MNTQTCHALTKEEAELKFNDLVFDIIRIFEEVLNENNIKIPDKNRIGEDDEACIYGETYYKIEDEIKRLINIYLGVEQNV